MTAETLYEYLQERALAIYGKERVSPSIERGVRGIIIHFPELTVTNGRRVKHEITDMWVKIFIVGAGTRASLGTSGMRTSFSLAEWISGYRFSHLRRSSNYQEAEEWNSFCFGSSAMSSMSRHINISLNRGSEMTDEDKLQVDAFLSYWPIYLSWESLGGGPHIKISDILRGSDSELNVRQTVQSRVLKKIARNMQTMGVQLPLSIVGGSAQIAMAVPQLAEYLYPLVPEEAGDATAVWGYNVQGVFSLSATAVSNSNRVLKPYDAFIFNGEPVRVRLKDVETVSMQEGMYNKALNFQIINIFKENYEKTYGETLEKRGFQRWLQTQSQWPADAFCSPA